MDRRFEVRKAEMLADCKVRPEVFRGMMTRLDTFVEPFVACLRRPEQRCHTHTYLRGLLSDVERKNAEAIAYRHDEERQGLQTFLALHLGTTNLCCRNWPAKSDKLWENPMA